ncbi:thiolase family protein [Leucobacter luti]|uniref:Acetyl-CoA acetyltransferase n=1 Tax=Leucobacter luti TaxID=340320 RepID=A0A4Q7U7H0_9MICO|nr:thiolase family protein [Leucobacter luti]MBL3700999.1 thiolase family protein [Leucobacter luti]RZT68780.1 acetyl-CoA acetyltransferase [Leucobacter luti]
MRERAVVVAPVTVPYVRYSQRGAPYFIGAAIHSLCEAAGIGVPDIDGLALASLTMGPDSAAGIVDHLGIELDWLTEVTVGGAAGIVALRRAVTAVDAGDAEIVACVGADTNRPGQLNRLTSEFSGFTRDAVSPYGAGGPNGVFALITQVFMRDTGVTAEDLGKLCVASRLNAAANPLALLRTPYTLDEYLTSRPIADPLRLLDCVMPCAGAEAFLVMSETRAESLGLRPVRVLASFESYNDFRNDPVATRGGWARHAAGLWARAGVQPDDVDLVQSYDDYPVMVAMQLRDLGFAHEGGIAQFIRAQSFTVDGSFPHNTSGGQLSSGQAGFAGGFLGITETLRQLTGAPLGNAVNGARVGAVSGFGMVNFDRGIVSGAVVLGTP